MLDLLTLKRHSLALLCASLLASTGAAAGEWIIDKHSGRTLSRAELLAAIAGSDYLLLGEVHDNPLHHQRRGELLASLPKSTAVVAEHLELGRQMADNGALLDSLQAAGFDAGNWRWPLHGPLFSAIRDHGLALTGGNITRATARAIVREGQAALPPALAEIVAGNPLTAGMAAALDAELLRSHCGQVPATMIPGLRLAQQGRDAAMFAGLAQAVGKPAVLLAGNSHVRKDYGVPRLLAQQYPERRQISIAFVEAGTDPEGDSQAAYDYLWITDAAARPDPCADFKRPAA